MLAHQNLLTAYIYACMLRSSSSPPKRPFRFSVTVTVLIRPPQYAMREPHSNARDFLARKLPVDTQVSKTHIIGPPNLAQPAPESRLLFAALLPLSRAASASSVKISPGSSNGCSSGSGSGCPNAYLLLPRR